MEPTIASAIRHRPSATSPDRDDPQNHGAAGLAGQRRQRARLVGVAAGAERDPQNDVRDENVQNTADGEAGAGRVLERVAVGRPVGDALQWIVVDHGPVYPFFDGCETVRAAGVDEIRDWG